MYHSTCCGESQAIKGVGFIGDYFPFSRMYGAQFHLSTNAIQSYMYMHLLLVAVSSILVPQKWPGIIPVL